MAESAPGGSRNALDFESAEDVATQIFFAAGKPENRHPAATPEDLLPPGERWTLRNIEAAIEGCCNSHNWPVLTLMVRRYEYVDNVFASSLALKCVKWIHGFEVVLTTSAEIAAAVDGIAGFADACRLTTEDHRGLLNHVFNRYLTCIGIDEDDNSSSV